MGIGTNFFLRKGLKKRKRSKIKVPTKWSCNLQSIYDNLRCVKNPRFVPLQTLLRLSVRLFTTCVKIAFYSLSPESLRTMVLMRKDVLYEWVKRYVKKRKEDPYAFFTPSLRPRKFNFSCCEKKIEYHQYRARCAVDCEQSLFSSKIRGKERKTGKPGVRA